MFHVKQLNTKSSKNPVKHSKKFLKKRRETLFLWNLCKKDVYTSEKYRYNDGIDYISLKGGRLYEKNGTYDRQRAS